MEANNNKPFQLVLSVFKGLNFVVKKHGVKCKLICKVQESFLESKAYSLSTTNSDPDFSYQVAWKLSKKQVQDLRLNRGVVKIECHQLDKDGRIETLIGYCTISVKDAIVINSYEEIDGKNSVTIPLKGTKIPWLQYSPKLQLLLHLEDPDKPVAPASTRKMVLSKNPVRKDSIKAPLPPPPSVDTRRFQWEINDEMGYFQLGKPEPNDDLYIVNITLICVRHLEKLLTQKSPAKDLQWMVEFEAYGMSIDSDPFCLQGDDEVKPTYLGDKSTARIRANAEDFTRYLKETELEIKIKLILDEKEEVVGTGWIALESLTAKDNNEIRGAVEIVSQQGKLLSRDSRPSLAYAVDVQKSPGFFGKNYIRLEQIGNGQNLQRSREDLSSLEKDMDKLTVHEQSSEVSKDDKEKLNRRSTVADEVGAGDKVETSSEPSKEKPTRSKASVPEETKTFIENTMLTEASGLHRILPDIDTSAADSVSSQIRPHRNSSKPKPKETTSRPIDRLPNICTPGSYSLTLKFTGFEVRVKSHLKGKWILSFWHPPLGVTKEQRTALVAKPEMTGEGNKAKFSFDEGEEEQWEFMVPKIGTEILETPLKVYFYAENTNFRDEPIAFAHIPLGDIFLAESGPSGRKLEGAVGMYTIKPSVDKPIKIGYLGYDFTLRQGGERSANVILESPSATLATPSFFEEHRRLPEPESPYKPRMSDLGEWKRQEEQLFRQRLQEKERAYFQMLSMEHKKQREESEKAVRSKMQELETMKKQYNDKLKELAEKEEHLKLREAQLTEANQSNLYELTKERDDLKLLCRRLEADKKLEVEGLGKRLDDALNVAEVYQSRIRALETKLEMKDAKIAELTSEKNKSPELEALRKIDLLEQKIKQLGKDLDKALQEKEHYRSQSKQLAKLLQQKAEERQELLREENENLKLQMLASRQQELLTQDLKQVASLSSEIKAARDILGREGQPPPSRPRESDPSEQRYNSNGESFDPKPKMSLKSLKERDKHLEEEIERLTKNREGLLRTQAYTQYDPLIRELEDAILRNIQLRTELQSQHSDY